MGNYKNIEIEFIERTLELISQYESMMRKFEFEKQFNHTLLVNCLLGLIVFPKEKIFSYSPKSVIDKKLKKEMGIVNTTFNNKIKELRDLIIALRHSIAHFDISFTSLDQDKFLIDRIIFSDEKKGNNYVVASFVPSELLSFIRYYGYWMIYNIRLHEESSNA